MKMKRSTDPRFCLNGLHHIEANIGVLKLSIIQ